MTASEIETKALQAISEADPGYIWITCERHGRFPQGASMKTCYWCEVQGRHDAEMEKIVAPLVNRLAEVLIERGLLNPPSDRSR